MSVVYGCPYQALGDHKAGFHCSLNVAQILGFAAKASDKRNRAKRKGEILQLLLEDSHYFLCHGTTSKFGHHFNLCNRLMCITVAFKLLNNLDVLKPFNY